MPNFTWRTSLSLSLAIALGSTMALIWVLTASVVLYINFNESQHDLVEGLENGALIVAEKQNSELESAARDVRTLINSWQRLPDRIGRGPDEFVAARRLITDSASYDNPVRVRRGMVFVEAYGSGGLGNLIETFVILNGSILLSRANTSQDGNLRDPHDLLKLREIQSENGLIWGKPFQTQEGTWQISVAAKDPITGAIIGVTERLSLQLKLDWFDDARKGSIVWTASDGKPLLPISDNGTLEILAKLPQCQTMVSQRVDGVWTVCYKVAPLGWKLVLLYPKEQITEQALWDISRFLPLALLTLLALVALLYVVLQHKLGRVLNEFVRFIKPEEVVTSQQRLPENRRDELGQFATAYNRLLKAVQEQYVEMEATVAARTSELEIARHKAERANENKSEQITSISHEIRTPLNGIVGALRLLGQTPCNVDQRNLVDISLKCSGHLLEIINNLLDFSRIDSGQMVLTPSIHAPLALIDHAMLTVQVPAREKQLVLRCLVDSSFPERLLTDGLRLRQILINLLGNAVKFTERGNVELFAWCADGKVYFRVHDSGPGIPTEKHEDVFIAFRQLEVCVSGSGLGLPIARRLAQLLGGDLRLVPVESGACFQLELPLGDLKPGQKQERGVIVAPLALHAQLCMWGYTPEIGDNPILEEPELIYLPARLCQHLESNSATSSELNNDSFPSSPWSLNVLIVDDIDTNRDIIGRMLELQGHRVRNAACGKDALELGRAHIFDLVLMDMRMPVMSGEETVSLWRDEQNGMLDPECPIIALTANAKPGERERLLRSGFNEYLTKPVSSEMLSRAMDYAADQQLSRGMELDPNPGCNRPVLDSSPMFMPKLRTDLHRYYQLLGDALQAGDMDTALDALHSFKGLVGQAGLTLLFEAAEHWETVVFQGKSVDRKEWSDFSLLIESEVGTRAEE